MRVLVANEPYVYREVMAEALRRFRPHEEVSLAEPGELDREVSRLAPHLVVFSRIDAVVATVFAWVLLYPDGENRAEIKAGRYRVNVAGVELGDLVWAADPTEQLLPKSCAGEVEAS